MKPDITFNSWSDNAEKTVSYSKPLTRTASKTYSITVF